MKFLSTLLILSLTSIISANDLRLPYFSGGNGEYISSKSAGFLTWTAYCRYGFETISINAGQWAEYPAFTLATFEAMYKGSSYREASALVDTVANTINVEYVAPNATSAEENLTVMFTAYYLNPLRSTFTMFAYLGLTNGGSTFKGLQREALTVTDYTPISSSLPDDTTLGIDDGISTSNETFSIDSNSKVQSTTTLCSSIETYSVDLANTTTENSETSSSATRSTSKANANKLALGSSFLAFIGALLIL